MQARIRLLLTELKSRMRAVYGDRLKAVYLFGSYARDDANETSDVDVLIVLAQIDRYSDEISRSSEIIGDLSLRYGLSISRVFASEEQWHDDPNLFFTNLREEAVPA